MDTISWPWKTPSVFTLVWLTLCNFHNKFEIHFLPVYYPNEEEKLNTELYANNVRKEISSYLKMPLSDYSYEDVRMMSRIEKHGLPYHIGLIGTNKVKKALRYIN